jgi:RimJ/RimL family protein N-acetyltransferase
LKTQDLPIGERVERAPAGPPFERQSLQGRSVALVPLRAGEHAAPLYASFRDSDPEGRLWTYMGYGPFSDLSEFRDWLEEQEASDDPLFYAIIPAETGAPAGMASFMRMDLRNGVAEIGNIWFSPRLQKSRASSEAIFLMMRHVLETRGCRRLEWKCNALNAASRRAAERYGFAFEGIFRNHLIVKGRNRDTAWYSIIDTEWPRLNEAFESWLDDGNFGPDGTQITSLGTLTAAARR